MATVTIRADSGDATGIPKGLGSIRQTMLLNGLIEGKTLKESAAQIGPHGAPIYASVQSASNTVANMRSRVCALMDELGLSESAIILKLRSKMDATETKFAQSDGQFTDAVETEAHGVQLQATELAANIRGMLRSEGDRVSVGTVNISWGNSSVPDWAQSNVIDCDASTPGTPVTSAIEGTESGPGPSTDTLSAKIADSPQAKVKRKYTKGGPRLPVAGRKWGKR